MTVFRISATISELIQELLLEEWVLPTLLLLRRYGIG